MSGDTIPSWRYRCPDCLKLWHPGYGPCSIKRCPACEPSDHDRATPEETHLDADGKLGVLPGDW